MDPEEAFLTQRNLVVETLKQLDDMANSNKAAERGNETKTQEKDISAGVTDDNYLVFARVLRQQKSSARNTLKKMMKSGNVNLMPFMRQIDMTRQERIKAHEERQIAAENFRRLGNEEFRKGNYDKSIYFYSKGLQYVTDTPVLYCNRALAKIKKREFKSALLDLDMVVFKLDPGNMRGWLYRAGALARINNEPESQVAIRNAFIFNRNPKDQRYIQMFVEKMRTEF
ncbi:tetratricopeptide repeat protein 12 [Drosophila guanche]|uniref:Blast:Tetratricopeptide repeat protein 12 n=1 Tax=Drosophila guanche TaxID=7266 RepID=A0A3B0KB88_DROGU|nr:tetratricopeptide repeat protein 12 [Drosophila guanche]SPP83369.1 blast:Tetratricopeptide repeat protein 12 [Drosophila guanche]